MSYELHLSARVAKVAQRTFAEKFLRPNIRYFVPSPIAQQEGCFFSGTFSSQPFSLACYGVKWHEKLYFGKKHVFNR